MITKTIKDDVIYMILAILHILYDIYHETTIKSYLILEKAKIWRCMKMIWHFGKKQSALSGESEEEKPSTF